MSVTINTKINGQSVTATAEASAGGVAEGAGREIGHRRGHSPPEHDLAKQHGLAGGVDQLRLERQEQVEHGDEGDEGAEVGEGEQAQKGPAYRR